MQIFHPLEGILQCYNKQKQNQKNLKQFDCNKIILKMYYFFILVS